MNEANKKNRIDPRCIECGSRASIISLLTNIFLTFAKGFLGIIANSKAVLADAFHSATDVINSLVIVFCMRYSKRSENEKYPYGYAKIEFIASILVGCVLMLGGILLIWASVKLIISGHKGVPKMLGAGAAILSIAVNLLVSSYTMCPAKKLNSLPLITSAWDNRSDMLSSIPVFFAVVGSRMGLHWLDPLAGIIIGIVILKAQIGIIYEGYKGLMDAQAMNPEEINKIKLMVAEIEGIKEILYTKTRRMGEKFWLDIGIVLDNKISITDASQIKAYIKNIIKKESDKIGNINIFTEAYE